MKLLSINDYIHISMTTKVNPIAIDFSNEEIRLLVEEYLSMQKADFSLKSVCSYVLYWAMEEGRVAGTSHTVYESNQMEESDCERINLILESIVKDGRIRKVAEDEIMYLKQ